MRFKLKKLKRHLAMFLACMVFFGITPWDTISAEAAEEQEDSLTIEGYSPYSTKNEEVLYGDSLLLRVKASSTVSDVSYQWQSGPEENKAEDIAGATGAEYVITNAGTDTPKFFQCLVWDENHKENKLKVRFNVRVETILLPDGNTKESWSYYIHAWEGNEVTLSPEAESPFPMTYQWKYYDEEETDYQKRWKDLENETGGSYTFSYAADSLDRYQCYIQNEYGRKTITYYLNRHTPDEPEPVKMEFSPTIRDWYIYEQTGENLMSLSSYSNHWPGQNGAIKVTYKDGSEQYISSNYSQSALPVEKNDDGSWKAGDYAVKYGYMNLSAALNIHIVRIGENGADLVKGEAAASQTAGNAASKYQYYRIQPAVSGTYEVNVSNVNGAGRVNLYRENEVSETTLRVYFESLQEMEFSDAEENKMICTLEGGVSYFLVVRADDTQVGYDIIFDEFTRTLPLDTEVSVDGIKEFTFTPEKSGYYTLEYLSEYSGNYHYYAASADVYTSDMSRAGSLNDRSALYMRSGVKYNIILSSNYDGVPNYNTIKFRMISEAQHPENIVQAALSGGLTVTLDDTGLLTYEKTGDGTDGSVISETRDGFYGVLADNSAVKKIVIKEGIRKLADNTFHAFENLAEVTLPASLEEIGTYVFSDCTKLETVAIPEDNSLTSVGEEAFRSTPFLNDQTGNYKMLGTIVIKYTGEETETLIPEKTTLIAGSAMRGSETLEKITILDKVKRIGELGMADCTSLSKIDVPGNVTDISYCAFYHNTAMEQAVLSEGVERIGEEAFFACTNLKKIYIPKSVNYIGSHAIGYADWSWNTYSYNLSEELPTIYCYYNTSGYHYAKSNRIPYEILDEKNLANKDICRFSYTYKNGVWPVRPDKFEVKFADEILQEGTDYSISYQDAADQTKTTVAITGMGDYFGTRTEELFVNPQSGDNHDPDKKDPNQEEINHGGGKALKEGTVITEPGTGISYKVTKSGTGTLEVEFSKALNTMKGTVKIPASVNLNGSVWQVTAIGANAFANNKKIKKVEIGNGIKTIGENAFLKCTSLKQLIIGKNVSKIGKKAFGGCKKLKTITIKTTKLTKQNVGKGAFSGTPSNAKVSVPKKKLKIYKTLLKSKGISKKAKIK